MSTHNQPAGFLPSQLVKGGLKTDFNGEITDCFWDFFTYAGKDGAAGKTAFGLHVHIKDEEGEEMAQFYSAGDASQWTPSADKSQPIPVTAGKSLTDSSNFALFIGKIITIGIPEGKLSSVKDLIGGDFFWSREAQPNRAGLESDDGKKRTTLVPTRINRAPWEAKKSAGKKAAAPSSSSSAAKAGEDGAADHGVPDNIVDACTNIVMELLGENPDGLALKNLVPFMNKQKLLAKDEYKSDKAAITRAILKPELLASLPGVKFENGVISYA